MRALWRELTDLVLPVGCAGCGLSRERGPLCGRCRGRLAAEPCRVWPRPVPPGLPVVYGAAAYADEVRELLLAHKERGALRLARPLGVVLAETVRAAVRHRGPPGGRGRGGRGDSGMNAGSGAGPGAAGVRTGSGPGGAPPGRPLALVAVPSSRRAVAARGHDPVRRMALAAAGELRRTGRAVCVPPVLRQRRPVADQARLTARQRLANLSGALEAVPGSGRLLGRTEVVLVDDLMTTGASLVEAARAITVETGRRPVAAVVAVRTRR
ncbi:ComF family protein [Streptomyces sp. NPDC054784]